MITMTNSVYYIHPYLFTCANICAWVYFLWCDSWSRYRTFPTFVYYIHPYLFTCANICAWVYFIDTWMGISSPKPLLTYHGGYITTFMLVPNEFMADTVSYGAHNEWEGLVLIYPVVCRESTTHPNSSSCSIRSLYTKYSIIIHYPS